MSPTLLSFKLLRLQRGLPHLALSSLYPSVSLLWSHYPLALPSSRLNPLLANKALLLVTSLLDEALPFLLQKIVCCPLTLP